MFAVAPERSEMNRQSNRKLVVNQEAHGSGRSEDAVIGLTRRVKKSGENVLALKKLIIGQNLVKRSAGAEQPKDVGHADTVASDAGPVAALARFDGDSGEEVFGHAE